MTKKIIIRGPDGTPRQRPAFKPEAPYGYKADGTPRKRPANSPETQAKVAAANRARAARLREEQGVGTLGRHIKQAQQAEAVAKADEDWQKWQAAKENVGKHGRDLVAEALAAVEDEIGRLESQVDRYDYLVRVRDALRGI